ncbi:hypothetical protein FN846DRAFT_959205 [Sphaerosporella brunnea]|uniref:AAA+ ATPase domain-containing protein n=1 Tax=Sphaerosporella brunnea TaxID=1250544 RepID=A0A5J5ES55_9PEZI|nr:hypothetical protein FN846DRAFT_959205 [Sphaerosporella brunnea]
MSSAQTAAEDREASTPATSISASTSTALEPDTPATSTPEPTPASTEAVEEKKITEEAPSKKRPCSHRKSKSDKEEHKKAEAAAREAAEKEKEKTEKEKEESKKDKKEKKEKKDEKEKDKDEVKKEKKDKDKDKEKKPKKDKKDKKSKKSKKSKKDDSDSDSDSSDSDNSDSDSSDSDSSSSSDSSDSSSSSDSETEDQVLEAAVRLLLARRSHRSRKAKKQQKKKEKAKKRRKEERKALKKAMKDQESDKKDGDESDENRASVLEYKRVDELYDKELHDWDIRDTVPHSKADKYSSFIFTVRRIFDYDGKYVETMIDVKSPLLKDALGEIMSDVRGVSLVEDVPAVDPNMLFNYYPEITAWVETASDPEKAKALAEGKKSKKQKIDPATGVPAVPLTDEEKKDQVCHVKLLIEYLDMDFKNTKATLFPLLENKSITFDLLWSILKPNTIMYTTCAGSNEPRAFKLEYAQLNSSFMRGKWWSIEGRYLEFDGKDNLKDAKDGGGFGWGNVMVDIDAFRGVHKINNLACYPLKYRKDHEELTAKLIERGKKFVSLRGMQYKAHNGLAFMKKKRQYIKVHVKGRIMIDPVTFRRINPNYVISSVKSRNNDAEDDDQANYFHLDSEKDEDEDDQEEGQEEDGGGGGEDDDACSQCCCAEKREEEDEEEKQRKAMRFVQDDRGDWHLVSKAEEEEKSMNVELFEKDEDAAKKELELTDEDYLIASPVVLGWAFNEKLWLEFPVQTVEDIAWNDKAFESLVLPDDQKAIVRALVESHTASSGSNTIDDIVAGKGRGLVSVLHGPPGVGKTLTAEGIAELLRRPLYCVSSGELGTNPSQLEHELQKILDIAHSWGAVLLLDEADVFLEKRTFADMHRNALVSIFLRLLEYFQGILFLTTNRVETFDEAFQSRIHIALRYNELGFKAKVKIWTMFFNMVKAQDGGEFAEADIEWLAKKDFNGRQIKNIVRTAQALAKSKRELMGMKHIRVVMGVAEGFENDLKGTGRMESMHAYA